MTVRAIIVNYFTDEQLSTHWVDINDLPAFVTSMTEIYKKRNINIKIELKAV